MEATRVPPEPGVDLVYLPDVIALEEIISALPSARILVLGKPLDLDGRQIQARHIEPPSPVLSAGVYLFRTLEGWDVLACTDGLVPGPPISAGEANFESAGVLLAARQWFDHFWDLAAPVGPKALFAVGDHVQLAGSDRIGRVDAATLLGSEWIYAVTQDRIRHRVSETGLEPITTDFDDPRKWIRQGAGTARQLSVALTQLKLSNPLTDTVYSYLSSKTVFRPYQFRPVLRFLSSSHQRLLIADEVGLGKTIEAGLIWTELEQRNHVRRCLVVCPATLVPKWRTEMSRRFDRRLVALDRVAMEEMVALFKAGDEETEMFGVVSLERLRAKRVLADLTEVDPRFDLVIVDEAHYLRNTGTLSHELGRALSDWADALVFLSATPLNLGHDDLFNLLNLLLDDVFSDRNIFPLQVEPNRYLNEVAGQLLQCRATPRKLLPALDGVATCKLGAPVTNRPEFALLRELVDSPGPLDWRQVTEAKRYLGELNTLSSVVTRTRKVDVPDRRAVREPVQVNVYWTDAEKRFYEAVLSWARRRAASRRMAVGFATQMPLRQAASCIPAMRDLLGSKQPELLSRDALLSEDFDDFELSRVDELLSLEEIRDAVLNVGDVDTKFERFVEALVAARTSNLKQVMVFSFFRRTLGYLARRLSEEGLLGTPVTLRVMHGGVPMAERLRIMDEFRSGDFDVLLLSEVGAEGLDFEFCNVLVNYDMPWNPMRVEQRIGRLDRFGQEHEKIFIYNFHVPGTIETDIFERLYRRIRVFEESIGELEPILRDETSALQRIALDPKLTSEQRRSEMERLEVALDERRRQLVDLREAQGLLAGVDQLLIDGFEQDTIARGRFVGPDELELYLTEMIGDGSRARIKTNPNTGIVELTGDEVLADRVARRGVARTGTIYGATELVRRLRDGDPVFATFSNQVASRSSVDLISIRHPLVRAATRYFEENIYDLRRYGAVTVSGTTGSDRYATVIYMVETTGLQPSLELWPVAVNANTGEVEEDAGFLVLAALTRGALSDGPELPERSMLALISTADQYMNGTQLSLEATRRQTNASLVDARKGAQRASYEQKIARTQATLDLLSERGRDPSLIRMYRSRIANLTHHMQESLQELDTRRSLALTVRPVAVAAVTVVPETQASADR